VKEDKYKEVTISNSDTSVEDAWNKYNKGVLGSNYEVRDINALGPCIIIRSSTFRNAM
jgi:hypothetical protein